MEQLSQLLDLVKDLTKQVQALQEKKPQAPARSENCAELFAALAKAQAEIRIANESADNPYFKSRYADLESIVKASRVALSKNGLAVIQQIMAHDDGSSVLNTLLTHSSGQWIESRMRITPAKNDIQSVGSCITYLRRYCYATLVGVVAGGEDDDAEAAMAPQRLVYSKATAQIPYSPKKESLDVITREQLEELEDLLRYRPDIAQSMMDHWKLMSLADMPKSVWRVAIERARSIKLKEESAIKGIKDPSITEL